MAQVSLTSKSWHYRSLLLGVSTLEIIEKVRDVARANLKGTEEARAQRLIREAP